MVKIESELIEEIKRIKKEKKAVIMAHYYQSAEIQDLADVLGDSLALAQQAKKINSDLVIVAGVRFMAETVKILNPKKKVLIPDISAGCSLADSCEAKKYEEFVKANPNYVKVSYVNCSAEVKAMSDILCTSSNAVRVINSISKDRKILFGPDKNLGCYLKEVTGRDLLIWDGACTVHESFSVEKVKEVRAQHPESLVLAHPECKKEILDLADYIGATSGILNFCREHGNSFIVLTEGGILHQLQKQFPEKKFYLPETKTKSYAICKEMRKTTLETLYRVLREEVPEILINQELREAALKPLERMLAV